jgi:hypothetical protein
MIMEGILKNWRGFVNEGFTEQGTPDLKYYAFDWDDNIVFMPTKIMLIDVNGEEVGMSTHGFAQYRHLIGKQEFDYEGHTIKDYATNPFRNFRVEGDQQFLNDAPNATPATEASFNDFKECVEGASIFAIITARGHNPETLKEGCKIYIATRFGGIDTSKVVQSIKKYKELPNIPEELALAETDDQLIDAYLKMCVFKPVSFGQGSAANPEQLKVTALNNFVEYVNKLAARIRKHAIKGTKLSIGFSDDDKKNIDAMIANFGLREPTGRFRKGGRNIRIKYTGQH